jgi:hypothetical protein
MKYEVTIQEVHSAIVEVEANTPAEARKLAAIALENSNDDTKYSYTLPMEDWPVAVK